MSKFLQNKVVVITGAAGLLGSAFVKGCAEAGAVVIAVDVDARAGARLISRMKQTSYGQKVFFEKCDTANEKQIKILISKILKQHKRIDALVNNAYPRNKDYGKKFEAVSFNSFTDNVAKHLGGYFVMIQKAAEVMKKQQGGVVVSMGSIYGSSAPRFEIYDGTNMTMPVEYSAIKAAIINMSKYLAVYLGPQNIRVNTLSPGGVFNNQSKQFVKKYAAQVPLGKRMAEPADIASALVFLLSDEAKYITGQDLIVDGGWSL